MNGPVLTEQALIDARHAVRRLARDWRFSLAAVLLLALGIGANAAVFSVVNAALFSPQPFRDPAGLVNIYQNNRFDGTAAASSFAAYLDMRARTDVFADVMATSAPLPVRYEADGALRRGLAEYATSSYAPVLGLTPARGRWFDPAEDQPGAPRVAVLAYDTWTGEFAGNPAAIGQAIRVAGEPVTVVGVAPPGLRSTLHAGLAVTMWLSISMLEPAQLERAQAESDFMVKARLRDGVDLPQARAAMEGLAARLARDYPDEDPGRGITVLASDDVRVHPQIDMLLMPAAALLLLLAGLVLVIACSNLATLLLVRGSARAREVAVRLALGATRGQLVRLLLVENLVLALAGGALGYLLAHWLLDIVALADLPLATDLVLDYRVLGFAFLLSLVTGVGTGLAPARAAARVSVVPELQSGGSPLSVRRRWLTSRNALVVAQMAASCVLLVAGGLVLQVLLGVRDVEMGYDVDGLALLQTDATWAGYDASTAPAVYEDVRARVAALPRVQSATLAATSPVGRPGSRILEVPGYVAPDSTPVAAGVGWAGPRYFETLGIPVLEGRTFSALDTPGTRAVVMINQTLARRYLGGGPAVGRTFRVADLPGADADPVSGLEVEVIGVVADIREAALEELRPLVYRSFTQADVATPVVIARTSAPPVELLPAMREALQAVDARLPLLSATTGRQQVDATLDVPRNASLLLGALGLIGLALASLGLYAVVAFAVSRRSLEVGIRMALGARRAQVVWTLSSDVTKLLAVGVGAGLGLSLLGVGALRVMAASLSEAPNLDITGPTASPVALAVVAALMLGVGMIAVLIPAARAARGSAIRALRDL